MKFRSTWLFGIVVAICVAYTIYDLRSSQDEVAEGQVDLFELKMEQVEQVSLDGPNGKILIKKSEGKWKVVEPYQDDAEELAIQSLLLTLLGENGRSFSESGHKDWENYGLAPAKLKIEVTGSGKTEALEVSSTNAFDGSFYLKSKDTLILGDKMWARIVDQKPNSLRDHKIFPPGQEVNAVDVTMDTDEFKGKYAFKKSGNNWLMTPDPGFPIDSVKVDHWLNDLDGLRAADFASEHLNSIEEFQLNKPSMTLHLEFTKKDDDKSGEKAPWDIKISPDHGDLVQIKTRLKPIVYAVGIGALRMIRVPPAFFRDGKVPLFFPLERAFEFDFHIKSLKVKVQRAEPDWKLVGESVLNQSRLIEFMQKIKSLEAVEFPKAGSGFSDSSDGLRITDKDKKVLLEIQIGDEYKATQGLHRGAVLNYVRVAGQKQILGVKSQELKELMAPDIVQSNVPTGNKGKSENH